MNYFSVYKHGNEKITPINLITQWKKSAYFSRERKSAGVSGSFLPGCERSTAGGVDLLAQRLEGAAATPRSDQAATQRRFLLVHFTRVVNCPQQHRRAAWAHAGLGYSTRYRPMSENGTREADKWARLRGDNARQLRPWWVIRDPDPGPSKTI